jgi:kynurenine formamidase
MKMKGFKIIPGIVVTLLFVSFTFSGALAGESWYPSKYGPDDELGALNLVTPAKTKAALQLIKEYKVYDLGMEYYDGFPAYPPRYWKTVILFHGMKNPLGPKKLTYMEEVINSGLGIGTQIDGLGHVGIGDLFYNGNSWRDIATPTGLKKFGSEKIPPVITRGLLIDMTAYKGKDMMVEGEVISVADIEGALSKQGGLRIEPGDVVLFHTGWSSLLKTDPGRFGKAEPGIGLGASQYLVDKGASMVGADTWALEVIPFEKNAGVFEPHQILLAKGGVYILENFHTADLARDKVYEFCIIITHPKITGAVQAILQPIAIK